MAQNLPIPDRRLTLSTVFFDFVAGALAFPLAALAVPPAMLDGDETWAVISALPFGVILLSILMVLVHPAEPEGWTAAKAITNGIWRSTIVFMALLWVLIVTGGGRSVPLGLFIVAWGVLASAGALVRIARLWLAPRILV